MDVQYQIKAGAELQRLGGDREGSTIQISQYMELKIAYQQIHRNVIENKVDYKQRHFHDYSVITTAENFNIEYAIKMTVDIYKQAEKKNTEAEKKNEPQTPAYKDRFFVFLIQHYRGRVRDIFQRAGATMQDYNNALDYFDERGQVHFNKPNVRSLDEIRRSQTENKREFDDFKQRGQQVIEEEIDDFVEEDY
eukprot:1624455-Amphidinium_carterae.1